MAWVGGEMVSCVGVGRREDSFRRLGVLGLGVRVGLVWGGGLEWGCWGVVSGVHCVGVGM